MASDTRSTPPRSTSGTAPPPTEREIIYYPAPTDTRISSSSAVRGPAAAAGSVDRANLSEEMARTYLAEGHRDEALEIYRLLLKERPNDADLVSRFADLQQHLGDEKARANRPKLAPSSTGPQSEPWGMLDLEELPETYGVNEVEVLYKDPWWSFVYWEVTEPGIEAARQQLGSAGQAARLVLRLFTSQPTKGTSSREVRDVPLNGNFGRRYLDIPRPGSYLRVAIGLLGAEGYFAPIAHSSLLRLPPPNPSPTEAVEWMQVQPPRGRGEQRDRILILTHSVPHHERGLSWRVAAVSAQDLGSGQAHDTSQEQASSPWWPDKATPYDPNDPSRGSGSGGLR